MNIRHEIVHVPFKGRPTEICIEDVEEVSDVIEVKQEPTVKEETEGYDEVPMVDVSLECYRGSAVVSNNDSANIGLNNEDLYETHVKLKSKAEVEAHSKIELKPEGK